MTAKPSKRETIKTEALRLFVERGVDGVSVRDIAAACDMKPANLYAHFASKDDLVAELFHEGYGTYGALLHDAAAGAGPFRPKLERMVRLICRLHDEDNLRFRFLLMTQHGYLATVSNDARNPIEILCRAVEGAMTGGEIPTREPAFMALALVGLIVQPATGHVYGRLTGGLLRCADDIVAMSWRLLS